MKREEINKKSFVRQEKYLNKAISERALKTYYIKENAQNINEKFENNQKTKDRMNEELIEKANKLEKEMKEKQEKIEKEKKENLRNLCIKQEDDYLKQYKKEQNIGRLERINIYKTEKRNEQIQQKEKKLEDYKNKKNELIKTKVKLTEKMEKEKEKLISDFEQSFKQKEQVDANELMDELFPKGKQLSEKDTKLKEKIEKLIEEMNKSSYKNESESN